MRVPLSWLADYVPLRLTPEEMAHRLTMAGIETEYDAGTGAEWGDLVVVGEVVNLEPHPNADRLRLATVNTGSETQRVVCGAPNIAVGQRIAFAKVGAKLTSGKTGQAIELTAATIRGVESAGMVCSSMELGMGEDHDGILVLDDDAPVGTPLAGLMGDDALEIEVTANRGDCLSVLGVAHEIAAITGETANEPDLDYQEGVEDVAKAVTVRIEDAALCYRYTATVTRGISVGPSPGWLKQRLEAAGLRSINNVVDVTNFVMLEYGQPLHAFDLNEVKDSTVIVRTAGEGEIFTSLDDAEHTLQPPMLLITDPQRAIGLAGVIGGQNSEMTSDTTDVLLESATFSAINTRRTSGALRIRTEASLRFEKGLNPDLAERALRRATALILETAGGTASRGIIDEYPNPIEPPKLLFTNTHMRRVLGAEFPQTQVIGVLRSLGFRVDAVDEDKLLVVPPYWRADINIEEDVIEEVARTIGYDIIPAEPLSGRVPETLPQPERDLREEVRDVLVGAGLQDTISHSLVSYASLERVGAAGAGLPEPLRTANPMSREHECLRTSLRGAMLEAAGPVVRQPGGAAAMFELGHVFIPRDGGLPDEREMLTGLVAGERAATIWEGQGSLDFFDAKGVVETVIERLGLTPLFQRGDDPLLHPGRTAGVVIGGETVGVVGELHPSVVERFDIDAPKAALFELDLSAVLKHVPWLRHEFRAISRFPVATRDLALVTGTDVEAGLLRAMIEDHPLVVRATLFDLFEGEGLPEGTKSLAFRLDMQSTEGTLDTAQLNAAVDELVKRLERETGARLRGQVP